MEVHSTELDNNSEQSLQTIQSIHESHPIENPKWSQFFIVNLGKYIPKFTIWLLKISHEKNEYQKQDRTLNINNLVDDA